MRFRTVLLFITIFYLKLVVAQDNLVQFVNPFIGTGGHGHTYPGATLPHGMVQLSPDTRLEGWDGCGGYHYSDTFIYGFSHTHLSGTGVSDYGDILLMPMTGNPSPDNQIYGSTFNHKNESASPGYYKVLLDEGNILAQLTSTVRAGFHQYTFSDSQLSSIILDLKHRDQVISSSLQVVDNNKVEGHRQSSAWARDQHVYFVLEFSKPFQSYGIWKDDQIVAYRRKADGKNVKAYFRFDTKPSEKILVKVGISSVSIDGARKNLQAEIPGWDFNAVKVDAEKIWNQELSKIEISSNDIEKKTIFYSALYHTAIVPNINMDVDRQYRGRDNKIHTASDFTNYSVFSLWDTYRAAHPLYTIIDKKRTLDYIKTFLTQYQQGGRLPVWELSSNETDCMIGYHSVPVIVDAAVKGIIDFDKELALEAMKKSANWKHLGLPALINHGYIGVDDEHESVSKTLEYAYDDWCIARFARLLGKKEDYKYYIQRSQYYKNLLDPLKGFIRPRKNGNWLIPFDPREVNNNYTEANGWQYNFYVPHDVEDYTKLLGGKQRLKVKLDKFFADDTLTGRNQADITGLIGQYAHGNEPSHHIAYLYNFVGKPEMTVYLINKIMKEMYHDAPDGLSGNEDCGQMSAWYVLSALGFYPVTPASGEYITGIPLFPEAKINLENGKTFTIRKAFDKLADNNSIMKDEFIYVTSLKLNGKISNRGYFLHTEIENGGAIEFNLSKQKPTADNFIPPATSVNDYPIVINPVIDGGEQSFNSLKTINIYSVQAGTAIYYTLGGSSPSISSTKYVKPFTIHRSSVIKAISIKNGEASKVTTANYIQRPNNWKISLNTDYEPQYAAGGMNALIDGIRGTTNWRMGNWQGYQGNDLEAIIDIGEVRNISQVTISLLQDTRSWIVLAKQIIIETSTDNKNFTEIYRGGNFLPVDDLEVQIKHITASFASTPSRYVKVKAIQYGKLPDWHEGAGNQTHIFADEIEIK